MTHEGYEPWTLLLHQLTEEGDEDGEEDPREGCLERVSRLVDAMEAKARREKFLEDVKEGNRQMKFAGEQA